MGPLLLPLYVWYRKLEGHIILLNLSLFELELKLLSTSWTWTLFVFVLLIRLMVGKISVTARINAAGKYIFFSVTRYEASLCTTSPYHSLFTCKYLIAQ
jgi:hypothetical protein